MTILQANETARETVTLRGRFRARICKLATGEIRLRVSPVAAGSLDQERKLQELYNPDIERMRDALPAAGHGSLGFNPHTGELKRPVFSARGRSTLREFGAVLDKRFGKNAVFFTLTLPASGDKAMRALAEHSSYVVSRVTQWLRDRLKDAWYGWVWEFQERGALHLHLVVGDDDYTGLVLLLLNWKDFAYDLLLQVETRASCDLLTYNTPCGASRERDYVQMDAVFVQYSAARYLAKYMGKARPRGAKTEPYYPARWWRVSNRALVAIRADRDTVELYADSAQALTSAIDTVMVAVDKVATEVRMYPNKIFHWLRNYIAYASTAGCARDMWNEVLNLRMSLKITTRWAGDYGENMGGGGGTSPGRGAPIATGLKAAGGVCGSAIATFSDICTLMNSSRAIRMSTA